MTVPLQTNLRHDSPGEAREGPRSLWHPLERGGCAQAESLITWEHDRFASWSWDDWIQRASRFAGGLRALGVCPGERVAFLLTNSFAACAGLLGTWLAGATVVSFPLPARGMDPAEYVRQLGRLGAQAQPALLVVDAAAAALLGDLRSLRVVAIDTVDGPGSSEPDLLEPDADALVQYSSGSTSEPRGCVLTARAVAAQLQMLERGLQLDPQRDTGIVWLPMSHDMCLFGCVLLTYWIGGRLVLTPPERFLRDPGSWMDDCTRFDGTIGATPNFALELAARVARARPPSGFTMTCLIVGGERVEPDTLERALEAFGAGCLPRSALMPAYGLAEAALAVSLTPRGEGPTITHVDRDALAGGTVEVCDTGGGHSAVSALVSAGPPLPGVEVRTVPADGLGEIVVSSPSLARGYLGAGAEGGEDGLHTGDLGFVHDGKLHVTGRTDDLISLAGRNLYARDIELAVAAVDGVRRGGCAVVDVRDAGSARLVAVVEPDSDNPDHRATAKGIADRAWASCGVRIHECVFVGRGQLPKTPSGKVQRYRARDLAQIDVRGVRVRP